MLNFRRVDRSVLAEWWWTVDRFLLAGIIGLALTGLVFSMAASPSIAVRLGLDEFYFVKRQFVFLSVGLCLMIGMSLLNQRQLRRVALLVLIGGFVAMIWTLFNGMEIKGARRWLDIAGFSLQPSEFIKPFFVLLSGWLFAEAMRSPSVPGVLIAIILLFVFVSLLLLQPDVGQALLASAVWGGMFFMTGVSILWVVAFCLLVLSGLTAAYFLVPHVTARIDRFLDPSSGDSYQIDKALEAIKRGGWFGRGPGEGQVKRVLPDSHTDFIFAVTAEEFGIVICLALLTMFSCIVLRILFLALQSRDPFIRFATAGLAIMFGLQAFINMGVNLALLPTKGMTLPFVSSGGSSLLSTCLAMGMVLGMTRRRIERDDLFLSPRLDSAWERG